MTIQTQFVAGAYTGAWNAQNLGLVRKGFEIRSRISKNIVTDSQIYGDTVLDAVYNGQNMFIGFTMMEFTKAILVGLFNCYSYGASSVPSASMSKANMGQLGVVGLMDVGSLLVKSLVLTAVAGSTAATSPATVTANQSILAEDSDINYMLSLENRELPLVLRLYPYTISTLDVFFSVT